MGAHLRDPSTELPGEGPVDRWTASRKEEVLRRIRDGEITAGQALTRWKMSVEELDAWTRAYTASGRKGLKAAALPSQGRLL